MSLTFLKFCILVIKLLDTFEKINVIKRSLTLLKPRKKCTAHNTVFCVYSYHVVNFVAYRFGRVVHYGMLQIYSICARKLTQNRIVMINKNSPVYNSLVMKMFMSRDIYVISLVVCPSGVLISVQLLWTLEKEKTYGLTFLATGLSFWNLIGSFHENNKNWNPDF